jgi:hypothetical protein
MNQKSLDSYVTGVVMLEQTWQVQVDCRIQLTLELSVLCAVAGLSQFSY